MARTIYGIMKLGAWVYPVGYTGRGGGGPALWGLGVRRGLDVAIALALGARAVLVGRPIIYALAAGGHAGVERAIAILLEEFDIAMRLLGATTPDGITAEHVFRA